MPADKWGWVEELPVAETQSPAFPELNQKPKQEANGPEAGSAEGSNVNDKAKELAEAVKKDVQAMLAEGMDKKAIAKKLNIHHQKVQALINAINGDK